MITELVELVRAWPAHLQFFFILAVSLLGTLITVVMIGAVGEFLTVGLPNILHGHPDKNTQETDEEG